MPAELLLRGGRVVDGTGAQPCPADVLVGDDGVIRAVGRPVPGAHAEVLDVTGRLIMPGFVDAHSHADGHLRDPAVALSQLRQGVTTVITGQDGLSFAPSTAASADDLDRYFAAVNGPRPPHLRTARSIGDALAAHDHSYLNVAALVPAGNVRAAVMGFANRPASAGETRHMRDLVAAGLADGAVGLSTGLEYVPGGFADTNELVALCRTVAEADAVHVSHMRGYEAAAPAGLAEIEHIAHRTGVASHISHLHAPAATVRPLLANMLAAGVDLSFDSYPYHRGSTILAMLALPPHLQCGPAADTLAALGDPAERRRLEQTWFPRLDDLFGRLTIAYVNSPRWAWSEGVALTEAAERAGCPVGELVCRLLLDAGLAVGAVVAHPGAEPDSHPETTPGAHPDAVRELLRHPAQMAGSDGIFMGSHPHPRARGAFARLLRRHTVDNADWTWGQAARHLSTHAVERFGLGARGRVAAGWIADLAVVDPATVTDNATYREPLALASGVDHVLLGGRVVLRDGALVGSPAGRALTRATAP